MAFTIGQIDAVWTMGKTVAGSDPGSWRKDECDAWIKYSDYGKHNSPYGWEINHIISTEKGGSESLSNLRPLQWENSQIKSSEKLDCVITSTGAINIKKTT